MHVCLCLNILNIVSVFSLHHSVRPEGLLISLNIYFQKLFPKEEHNWSWFKSCFQLPVSYCPHHFILIRVSWIEWQQGPWGSITTQLNQADSSFIIRIVKPNNQTKPNYNKCFHPFNEHRPLRRTGLSSHKPMRLQLSVELNCQWGWNSNSRTSQLHSLWLIFSLLHHSL